MGSENIGPKGDVYRNTRGGTVVGKGEGIQSGDRNRLLGRNIPVANTTLGEIHMLPLPMLRNWKNNKPNMSILGEHEGQLERER